MRRDITGRPGHIHILTTYGSVCAIAPQPQEQRAGAGAAKTATNGTADALRLETRSNARWSERGKSISMIAPGHPS
jgi:NAD(P)-dependent dehydrogenase (short-subunit alcohol dehydrogenase family)